MRSFFDTLLFTNRTHFIFICVPSHRLSINVGGWNTRHSRPRWSPTPQPARARRAAGDGGPGGANRRAQQSTYPGATWFYCTRQDYRPTDGKARSCWLGRPRTLHNPATRDSRVSLFPSSTLHRRRTRPPERSDRWTRIREAEDQT